MIASVKKLTVLGIYKKEGGRALLYAPERVKLGMRVVAGFQI